MSPFDWVSRPEMVFEQLSEERGTLCWLPNFAFSLCASRIQDSHLEALDLSSVRAVINCSEPITATAMTRFAHKLCSAGLRRSALSTSYAMAETTFAATQTRPGREPRKLEVVRSSLKMSGLIERATPAHAIEDIVVLVSSGRVLPNTRLEIVDGNAVLPDGVVGEIRIDSGSRMSSYFRDSAATEAVVEGSWYASGDLGFVSDGELYVTGRKKDLIIVAGRNIYPYELEEEIGHLPGVKAGRVVVFGIFDDAAATEHAVVLAEVMPGTNAAGLADLAIAIRGLALAQFGVALADVKLLREPVLHKSTSGKLSRDRNRTFYLNELR
jgi:fatty-acyl-CoA synthase